MNAARLRWWCPWTLGLLVCACDPVSSMGDGGQSDASVADGGVMAANDAGHSPLDGGAEPDSGTSLQTISDFWANTQWPPYLTVALGESATVYGQVWVSGGTEGAGAMGGLVAEVGLGPAGSDRSTWTWTPAQFNVDVGQNDEFKADLKPSAAGAFEYAFRYRVAGARWSSGGEWLYAGLKGPTLAAGEAGVLATRGTDATVRVATQNLMCLRENPIDRLNALASRWAELNLDVVLLQEVCEAPAAPGNTADYLAKKLSMLTGRPWRHLFVQTDLANNVTPEGLGLLTALPLAATATASLPTQEFPRKALLGLVATPIGMLAACSTHLSFRAEDADYRLQQAQAVLGFVNDWQAGAGHPPGTAAVIAGDFNTSPATPPIQALTSSTSGFTDTWASLHAQEPGFSFPSSAPTERIDYIFWRGANGVSQTVTEVRHEFKQPYSGSNYVSDHSGFVATVKQN